MPAMRVSLVGRFVSHPTIDFGAERRSVHRSRLGLDRLRIVYHRPRRSTLSSVGVAALRSQTSRFTFPAMRPASARPARRSAPFGLPRARRA
jgi:hypothetical protein